MDIIFEVSSVYFPHLHPCVPFLFNIDSLSVFLFLLLFLIVELFLQFSESLMAVDREPFFYKSEVGFFKLFHPVFDPLLVQFYVCCFCELVYLGILLLFLDYWSQGHSVYHCAGRHFLLNEFVTNLFGWDAWTFLYDFFVPSIPFFGSGNVRHFPSRFKMEIRDYWSVIWQGVVIAFCQVLPKEKTFGCKDVVNRMDILVDVVSECALFGLAVIQIFNP